jgi:glycosyltransferase involved in cell wall biosynthesis
MKIVYIATSTIPSRSANSIHVMKMCQAFANNGHKVTLVAKIGQETEQHTGDHYSLYGVEKIFVLKRIFVPKIRVLGIVYYWFRCMMVILKQKPDLVYAREIMGSAIAAGLGYATVCERHDTLVDNSYEGAFNWLLRNKNLKRLVLISNALKEHIKDLYNVDEELLLVAHDASDMISSDKDGLKHLVINKERMQVGYVGHLYKGKGAEVITKLSKVCSWADFHLIGGNSNDIDHWQNQTLNQSNIYFHGHKSHSVATACMRQFDCLLGPFQKSVSVAGGKGDVAKWMSPLKIFEYMASGKPIICSDLPVLREVMIHKQNALLCPPDNIDAWKDALIQLREDKKLGQKLASNAMQNFLNKHTWQKRAEFIINQIYCS